MSAILIITCVFSAYSFTLLINQSYINDLVFGERTDSILFTGDIMLARRVEDEIRFAKEKSIFRNVRAFQHTHSYVIGNFESAIPEVHVKTGDFTFQFSSASSTLSYVYDSGFTHLSLANNHAYDFGEEGNESTVRSIHSANMTPFGNAVTEGENSITRIDVNGETVSIIAIHAVWRSPDMNALKQLIVREEKQTDIQIAVIHWGIEYESVHSQSQEQLAHSLIDMGVDAIIGHHPHVIQDIGLYKNAPIFYSLGNYVFDQYWNEAVQTGLTVSLVPNDDTLTFKIVPIKIVRSVPEVIAPDSATILLNVLSKTSEKSIMGDVTRGLITVRR